jgi:hypothetical protein
MADINIGAMAATTMSVYRKTFGENVYKSTAVLDHLRANKGIEEKDGGESIIEPAILGKNTLAAAFGKGDTFTLTDPAGIDAAKFEWTYYNVPIMIDFTEKVRNKGKSAVLDLLKGKIMQAEGAMAELINGDLIAANGTNKKMTGFETAIAATGTYGGISPDDAPAWVSHVDATAENLTFADIRKGKNTANNGAGGGKISLIAMHQDLYEYCNTLLTNTVNFNPSVAESKRLADAGFESLQFEGVPMIYDESVTEGTVFGFASKNWKMYTIAGSNFTMVEKSSPANQHIDVMHIVSVCQLVTNRRASAFKLTNKLAGTAS